MRVLFSAAIVSALALNAFAAAPKSDGPFEITQTVLYEIGRDENPRVEAFLDPQFKTWLLHVTKKPANPAAAATLASVNPNWIIANGKAGPKFDLILMFRHPIIGNRDGGPAVGPIYLFDPSGEHFAYVASRNRMHKFVYDNVEGPDYDVINPQSVQLGTHGFAYIATTQRKTFIVHNDKTYGSYGGIKQVALSDDGKHFAAIVGTPADQDHTQLESKLIYDGKELGTGIFKNLKLSPTGDRCALLVYNDGVAKTRIVGADAVEYPISFTPLGFTADSKHLLSSEVGGDSNRIALGVAVDGNVFISEASPVPGFSADEKYVRIPSNSARPFGALQKVVAVDGKSELKLQNSAFVSPDLARYVTTTTIEKNGVVGYSIDLDDKNRVYSSFNEVKFLSDGRVVTLRRPSDDKPPARPGARSQEPMVVQVESKAVLNTSFGFDYLAFSKDNRYIAAPLQSSPDRDTTFSINGTVTKNQFGKLLTKPVFTAPDTLSAIVQLDMSVVRVDLKIVGKLPELPAISAGALKPEVKPFTPLKTP